MKSTPDSHFVAHLLTEELEGPFREQLLRRTIRTARRRRYAKGAVRATALLISLGLMALVFQRVTSPRKEIVIATSPPAPPAFTAVRTERLPANARVRSTKMDSIVIQTPARSHAPRASDADLFVSLGDRPAALVRTPGQPTRLILAQADRKSRLQ